MRHAIPAHGELPGCFLSGGRWAVRRGGHPVRGLPAAGRAWLPLLVRPLAQAGQRGRDRRPVGGTPDRTVPRRALHGAGRPGRTAPHRLSGPRPVPGTAAGLLGGGPRRVRGRGAAPGDQRTARGAWRVRARAARPGRRQPARFLGQRPSGDLGVEPAGLRLRARHRPAPADRRAAGTDRHRPVLGQYARAGQLERRRFGFRRLGRARRACAGSARYRNLGRRTRRRPAGPGGAPGPGRLAGPGHRGLGSTRHRHLERP